VLEREADLHTVQQFLDRAKIDEQPVPESVQARAAHDRFDGSTNSGGRAARRRSGSASWPKSAKCAGRGTKKAQTGRIGSTAQDRRQRNCK
jgi:hypothetical protein